MDIYAPLAPDQGPLVGPLALSGQLQMERTSDAGIRGLRRRGTRLPEWFGGCTSKDVVEQRQKRRARRRRLQRDEVGIRLYNHIQFL